MSNLKKVYSPEGEMFEMTHLNANDLVSHTEWSYDAPKKEAADKAHKEAADVTTPKDESEPDKVEEKVGHKEEVKEVVKRKKTISRRASQ